MGNIFRWIYAQPLRNIIFTILLLPVLWTVLQQLLRKRQLVWRIINAVVFINSFAVILYLTLFHREGAEYDVILTPFHSFIEARVQPEMYRSMLMNVFLFEPLGLSLPAFLYKRKHQVMITVLAGLLLSGSIESMQYFYSIGRCEVDDVLMNTLGCIIGTTPYLLKRHLFLESK